MSSYFYAIEEAVSALFSAGQNLQITTANSASLTSNMVNMFIAATTTQLQADAQAVADVAGGDPKTAAEQAQVNQKQATFNADQATFNQLQTMATGVQQENTNALPATSQSLSGLTSFTQETVQGQSIVTQILQGGL